MGPIAKFSSGVLLPILVAVVLMVGGATSPGEFMVVRVCIAIAAAVVFSLAVWLVYREAYAFWHYALAAFVVTALLFGVPRLYEWVDSKENVPRNTGTLIVDTDEKFSDRPLEFGDSGVKINFQGPGAEQSLEPFRLMNLKLENEAGKLLVSSDIRDRQGKLVAQLIRNQWKTAPNPQAWDRNYNENTLEVIDNTGRIVLQVRVLPNSVQMQGEWWRDATHGWRFVKSDNPAMPGGFMILFGPNKSSDDPPFIKPLFAYPSESHFGELLK
jgi:hypothetical protein